MPLIFSFSIYSKYKFSRFVKGGYVTVPENAKKPLTLKINKNKRLFDCALDVFNFHSLNRCVYDFEYQFFNAVCVSALLNELIFQFNKTM